jgi:RNA polymerase sigma-70 factor (ECF subfamily)
MDKADPNLAHSAQGGATGQPSSAAGRSAALLDSASFVAEHAATAYRYAYRLSGSVVDAEDLTQQAFLLAHERLEQLRTPEHARAWLLTIVRNCFLRSRRKLATLIEPLVEEPLEESTDLPDWVDPERLQQALGSLPDDARVILVMFFFEECSYKEIAESLEVPIGTVMSRLSRAKARLRQLLEELESPERFLPPATRKVVNI